MKSPQLKQKYHALIPALLCSGLLVACQTSETIHSTPDTDAQNEMPDTQQPAAVSVTSINASHINLQTRSEDSQFSLQDAGADLSISISYTDIVSAAHTQIFLNTDNDTKTGFGFYRQAWGSIGADYMIQDEYLYKSLSNDAQWEWQPVAKITNYTHSSNQIDMVISKSLIGNPCGSLLVGTMSRNESWGVESMHPIARELSQVSIASCMNDVLAPVVTLNGNADITVTQGTLFIDPGATAIDDIDGDISPLIQVEGSVDTGILGSSTLVYSATDATGNVGMSPRRIVNVVEETAALPPVGLYDSWDTLGNQQSLDVGSDSTLTLKGHQDATTNDVYLQLKKSDAASTGHIQTYLDTDNDPSTGYQAWASNSTSAEAGAEYMIEDGLMFKYTGTGIDWSWSDQPDPTPYFYTESASDVAGDESVSAEMRSIFSSSIVSGNNIGVMILRMNADWTSQNIYTPNAVYTLQATSDAP